MPKTIVVPLDGLKFSERALVPAVELAAQCGAEVVVVTVRPGGPTGDEVPDLEPALLRAGAGSARIVVVESRSAAEGIATLAASQPDPVVCMTTHARSRAGQAVFGSVAEELIRTTDVPIVFVGPSATTRPGSRFEELVVCLDGSRAAHAVLPVASSFATDLGLSTWLIEVIDPSWREAAPTAGDDIGESYALHHAADELRASGLDANWETLHGDDPATAIEEFSRTLGSPVIAMTTHGRSGLARVAVGSVAMSVVRRAGCPVLVSRSRGLEG
jgi:nucleotide-binding universal stress UspA family protein